MQNTVAENIEKLTFSYTIGGHKLEKPCKRGTISLVVSFKIMKTANANTLESNNSIFSMCKISMSIN